MPDMERVGVEVAGGTRMEAALALPEGAGPFPGVVVIHEAWGLNDDIRRIAQHFADNGYAALAPNLFHRGPKMACVMRAMRDLRKGTGETFADLDAAREHLASRPEVDGSRIGVAGFCMGGGFALLYAARAPVGATAPFYGEVPKSADKLRGVPPVVASFGGRDMVFGKKGTVLEKHLRELGVPHDVKTYPEAGHSFMSDVDGGLLAKVGGLPPMHARYDERAAQDAWSRVLAFFAEHLR